MIVSVDEQIAAMAQRWPQFSVTDRNKHAAVWEGVLAPDKREHVVQIAYRVPLAVENITALNAQPMVQIIRPTLERHPDYEQGPIPHVYWSRKQTEPFLCLFDPTAREWGVDDYIANTTVYWAAEWIYFYEGWLITKRWRGGGVYHDPLSGDPGRKHLETV